MKQRFSTMKLTAFATIAVLLIASGAAYGQTPQKMTYPSMAPIEKYLMSSPKAEIAAARSAAPPSVSSNAEVLVLTKTGYVLAAHGSNGWVCFVERSWTTFFDDPSFWDPEPRLPNCFKPPAVRSVLPQVIAKTKWAIAGVSRDQMAQKARAAYASHEFTDPEPHSMSFMLSKYMYLKERGVGGWRAHIMLFITKDQALTMAAGLKGSAILAPPDKVQPYETMIVFIPVPKWSDGSVVPW